MSDNPYVMAADMVEYDLTTNFGLKKPWLDADEDVWGEHLNQNFDLLDNLLQTRGFDATKYLALAGGIMEGTLILADDPVTGLEAATKDYVDGTINREGGPFLPLTGGEITGDLQIDGKLRVGTTVDAGYQLDVAGTGRFGALLTALAGLTANGNVTLGSDTAAVQTFVNGPAGAGRYVLFRTASLSRWRLGANNTAETGANAGSDWDLVTFNDDGTNKAPNPVFRIFRATGNLSLGNAVDSGFRLDVTGTARVSGPFTLGLDTSGSAASQININGAVGAQRALNLRTASLLRWAMFASNEAETGANAGSNLTVGTYNDAGAYNGPALVINRATKVVTVSGSLANVTTLGQDTGATVQLMLNAPAGVAKQLIFRSASSTRWTMQSNATAESGSNAGSNFDLSSYDDTGAAIANPLMRIFRATGNFSLGNSVDAGFRLDVTGTGRYSGLLTLSANAASPPAVAAAMLQLVAANSASPQIVMDAAASNAQITMRRANGTIAAPSGLAAGNPLGTLAFIGYDTGAYTTSRAAVTASADAIWSPTSTPTRLTLSVTPVNSVTLTEVLRVQPTGNVSIGSTVDAGFKLDVVGTGRFSGAVTLSSTVGFNGTAPIAKPTVTGAKGSNAALASLLTALANYGLVTDSSTA